MKSDWKCAGSLQNALLKIAWFFSCQLSHIYWKCIALELYNPIQLFYTGTYFQRTKFEKFVFTLRYKIRHDEFNNSPETEVFCKDFVYINYQNALFLKVEDFMWQQLIYFLIAIGFWFVKCFFPMSPNQLPNNVNEFSLCCVYRLN